MIYLDNAATSYPKPDETLHALVDFVTNVGGNPGRSGHPLSIEAARIVFQAREKLTAFIKATDAPLDHHSLERLGRRALAGLARTGSSMSNGSGDFVVAFSSVPVSGATPCRRSPTTR